MTVALLRRDRIDGTAIDADLQAAFSWFNARDLTARSKTRCDSACWTNAFAAVGRSLRGELDLLHPQGRDVQP